MSDKFQHVKSKVNEYARVIGAPNNLLPTYGNSKDAHPNIELSDTGILSYEMYERGQQIKMEYAFDLDHLLYIIFHNITYLMALDYAAKNSDQNTDNRRRQFDYQLELLAQLNPKWRQREKEYQKTIEFWLPFKDYQGQRQSYLRELLGSGFLYSEAIEKVNQKYP